MCSVVTTCVLKLLTDPPANEHWPNGVTLSEFVHQAKGIPFHSFMLFHGFIVMRKVASHYNKASLMHQPSTVLYGKFSCIPLGR